MQSLLRTAAALPLSAALLIACGDQPTSPEPTPDQAATATVARTSSVAPQPAPAAADGLSVAFMGGLKRHVESYSGTAVAQSNFDLTLTCPNKMFAVSGGFEVGVSTLSGARDGLRYRSISASGFDKSQSTMPIRRLGMCLRSERPTSRPEVFSWRWTGRIPDSL